MTTNKIMQRGLALAAVVSATLPVVPAAVAAPPAASHRGNVIQRHPTATGVAAGLATHHALKVSARNKKARHQKLNFAERHPTITGIGAALGTRHVVKHSRR
jgi:hypothetical protein